MVRKTFFSILGFVAAVLFVFWLISFTGNLQTVPVTGSGGNVDLSHIDFAHDTAVTDGWLYYPNRHLAPADLPLASEAQAQNRAEPYGTYVIRLSLPGEKSYMLSFNSIEFSTRVYINGVLIDEVGKTTANAEEFEPVRRQCYYVVEPENGMVELVLQYTNFYTGYGNPPSLSVGEPARMMQKQIQYDFSRFTILAVYLNAFILYVGLFAFKTGARENLYFALICLILSIRECFIGEQFLFSLLPDISLRTIFTIQYLCIGILVILFFTYIRALFPGIVKKKGAVVFYIACLLFLLVSLFSRGNPHVATTVVFLSIGGFIILYLFVGMIRQIKTMRPGQLLSFSGLVILFVSLLNDMLHHLRIPVGFVGTAGLLQRCMIIFIFVQMAALFLQFIWVERQLGETREKEAALAARNDVLQAVDKQRVRFLSDVSHELKTPLTVMSNYTQLAHQHLKKERKADAYIEEKMLLITSEAKRMAAMIEQVLDIARIEEGRLHYEWKPVHLDLLITDLVEIYYPVLNKNHNRLEVDIPKELPAITADSERLAQVLLNLVNNAVRFTKNGVITISVQFCSPEMILSVSDTGIGMAPEQMDAIFNRYTTSKDVDDKKTGTGLGLYISKAIIEAHGGRIEVESRQGKGSKFTVYLPAEREGFSEGQDHFAD